MKVQALDNKITFGMFIKGLGNKLKNIMAKSISAEEKLNLIVNEMEKDTQEKRVTCRNIRTKMVALADPETSSLEPLEKLRVKRQKLVDLGAKTLKEKEQAEASGNSGIAKEKLNTLSKITKEIKSLDAPLNSMETTYQTLKEAYEVALENYKVALGAYEHAKNNGSAMLSAIKAHQEALEVRDSVKNGGKTIDASFLDQLENELANSQRELRSDSQLDKEIESNSEGSVLDDQESKDADAVILEEFRNAK